MIVTTLSALGVLFFCSLAGFAFAEYRFRDRTTLFALMLSSSMIPFPTGLATPAILTFLASRNTFLWPLVVPRDSSSVTLPAGMADILAGVSGGSAPPCGAAMVAATLVSTPVIAVSAWSQRYHVQGLTAGALEQ